MKQVILIVFVSCLIACGSSSTVSIFKDVQDVSDIEIAHQEVGDWNSGVLPESMNSLAFVPADEFWMGCDESKGLGCYPPELPKHLVFIDSFWIMKVQVTNYYFAEFLTNRISTGMDNSCNDGNLKVDCYNCLHDKECDLQETPQGWVAHASRANHPVTNVTWLGAKAFCQWVGMRLPTEAEWEKAARGIEGFTYPWGDDYPGWIPVAGEKCQALTDWELLPVGSQPWNASPYGVLDMLGGPFEWTNDIFLWDYYSVSPQVNPSGPIESPTYKKGPSHLEDRTLRGGVINMYCPSAHTTWLRIPGDPTGLFAPIPAVCPISFRCVSSEEQPK